MEQTVKDRLDTFLNHVEQLEVHQKAQQKTKETLEAEMKKILDEGKLKQADLEIVTNAISLLRIVSDNSVKESYDFITESVNLALARIFSKTQRKIRLNEFTRQGQYPQLEVILEAEDGAQRSLKLNSGHGLTQIISLLCILTLIVITKSRRILIMDEILSGLSDKSRAIVSDILWTFTEIGFQFILCEHGFVPKGSKVYELENNNGIGVVVKSYIEKKGVYLTYDFGVNVETQDTGDAPEDIQA